MSVEIHVATRGGLRPDPDWDPVLAVFYYIHNDRPPASPGGPGATENSHSGVIAIDVDDCGVRHLHSSRQEGGGVSGKLPPQSPRKQPIKSPVRSPWKQQLGEFPVSPSKNEVEKSPVKLPRRPPIKSLPNSSASLSGGRGSRPLNPARSRGFLEGCGVGEGVEVTCVQSEGELVEEVVRVMRR